MVNGDFEKCITLDKRYTENIEVDLDIQNFKG